MKVNPMPRSPRLTLLVFSFIASLPMLSLAQTEFEFCYTGPVVDIPDGFTVGVSVPLNVTGIAGTITSVEFELGEPGSTCTLFDSGIRHSYVGDLTFDLISPQGTEIQIMRRLQGGLNFGDNFCETVFTDSALALINDATGIDAPFSGEWQPSNPLSGFAGENPNGLWFFKVRDVVPLDAGTIEKFCVRITAIVPTLTPTPSPTESPSPTVSPSPTITPSPTETPSPTASPTASPTPSPTESPSPTPSPTESPSPTASPTPSPTNSPSPTPSPTESPSPTASPTPSPTESPSPTPSPTASPTESPSPTVSPTASPTESPSPTPSLTPSPTASPTPSVSPSPTASVSPTPIPMPSAEDVIAYLLGITALPNGLDANLDLVVDVADLLQAIIDDN